MSDSPWYASDAFWAAFQPILFGAARQEIAASEVDGFLTLTGLAPGSRVLDLGCGPGRHSLELARRGFRVTALDRTTSYLAQLAQAAETEGLPIDRVEADMRDLDAPATYDAVLCAFTTFGYFDDPADDERVLRRVFEALAHEGKVLIDVLGKEIVARGFVARWWTWLDDGQLLLEERSVEGDLDRMVNRWTLLGPEAPRGFVMRHRLYAASELRRLLEQAGFVDVRVVGGWQGEPYDLTAERLIVTGTRR